MLNNLPVYPDDYFNFKDNNSVTDQEINEIIKELTDRMLSDSGLPFASWSKGGTKITIFRTEEMEDRFKIDVYKKYYSEYIDLS